MNLSIASSALSLIVCVTSAALAQQTFVPPPNLPKTMEQRGSPIGATPPGNIAKFESSQLQQIEAEVPTAQLSKIARQPFSEVAASTRSAKDAEIYRTLSPSVVEILTQDGMGSGSLIGTAGEINKLSCCSGLFIRCRRIQASNRRKGTDAR